MLPVLIHTDSSGKRRQENRLGLEIVSRLEKGQTRNEDIMRKKKKRKKKQALDKTLE